MVFSHFFEDLFTLLDGQALGRTLLDTHHVVEAQVCNKKKIGIFFFVVGPLWPWRAAYILFLTDPRGSFVSAPMYSLHGLVNVVGASYGRYVALSVYWAEEWHVYVAFDAPEHSANICWWGRPVSWSDVEKQCDSASPRDVREAWVSRALHVDLVDYDTPDELEEEDVRNQEIEAPCHAHMPIEPCVLTIYVGRSRPISLELPPCSDAAVVRGCVSALSEVCKHMSH